MRLFNSITDKIKAIQLRSTNKKEFHDLVLLYVADGELSDNEVDIIGLKYREFRLEKEDIKGLGVKAYESAAKVFLNKGVVSDYDLEQLRRIQTLLMISDVEINEIKSSVLRIQTINSIQRGNLPIIQPTSLILQKNEVAYCEEFASLLEEKVVKRGYVGRSQGVSFRIAKGISYRIGESKGQLVSESQIITVATGKFVITNQRAVFCGDRKSFNLRLDSIMNVGKFTNGFNITDNKGSPKIVQLANTLNTEIIGLILSTSRNLQNSPIENRVS